MSESKVILLVCTGNSCRSVMAAGLLKEMLAGKKGNFEILTAGTSAVKGAPPTAETVQVMSGKKIDVSGHRSTPLTDEMINHADLILVMEKRHKEFILQRVPEAKDKVELLGEVDIPDPITGPLSFYSKVLDIIMEGVWRTAKKLLEEK
jgi:protein-tyrosine-phosphatase